MNLMIEYSDHDLEFEKALIDTFGSDYQIIERKGFDGLFDGLVVIIPVIQLSLQVIEFVQKQLGEKQYSKRTLVSKRGKKSLEGMSTDEIKTELEIINEEQRHEY